MQAGKTASTVDFVLEKKMMDGGAFSLESELSDYNHLGGYNGNYAESEGVYGLAAFLFPKAIGIGKIPGAGQIRDRPISPRVPWVRASITPAIVRKPPKSTSTT